MGSDEELNRDECMTCNAVVRREKNNKYSERVLCMLSATMLRLLPYCVLRAWSLPCNAVVRRVKQLAEQGEKKGEDAKTKRETKRTWKEDREEEGERVSEGERIE